MAVSKGLPASCPGSFFACPFSKGFAGSCAASSVSTGLLSSFFWGSFSACLFSKGFATSSVAFPFSKGFPGSSFAASFSNGFSGFSFTASFSKGFACSPEEELAEAPLAASFSAFLGSNFLDAAPFSLGSSVVFFLFSKGCCVSSWMTSIASVFFSFCPFSKGCWSVFPANWAALLACLAHVVEPFPLSLPTLLYGFHHSSSFSHFA